MSCEASAAVKCSPCEQSHRPCSWVVEYRRWRLQQLWEVDDAALDRLELAATTVGLASPRKTPKASPRVAPAGAGTSQASNSLPTTTSATFSGASPSKGPGQVKRKRPVTSERVTLKIPKRTATASIIAVPPPEQGTIRAPDMEPVRTRLRLEECERELGALRERAQMWEDRAQAAQESWRVAEGRGTRLQVQVDDLREEVSGLRRALAVANEQGSREGLESRVARLERRLERECSLFPPPGLC